MREVLIVFVISKMEYLQLEDPVIMTVDAGINAKNMILLAKNGWKFQV